MLIGLACFWNSISAARALQSKILQSTRSELECIAAVRLRTVTLSQ